MGVYIGQSTKIYDRATGEVSYGRIPAGSVVVSGNLPSADGKYSLYCAGDREKSRRPDPRQDQHQRAPCAHDRRFALVRLRSPACPVEIWRRCSASWRRRTRPTSYLSANTPILIKIHGQILQLSDQLLTPDQVRQLLAELLTPRQLEELDDTGELNVGIGINKVGSYRLSAFRQRGSVAAVFRCIPTVIPALDTLGVPECLGTLILEKRGLILMVGATGTGKSTTLASMLEWRNQQSTGHILTIEDPIEFLFTNKKSVVNQREVGRDTTSLQVALKNALRQAPDCILIGEIRDRETMTSAISYALSGHLVVATLHGNNSYHALGRILSFYTPESRPRPAVRPVGRAARDHFSAAPARADRRPRARPSKC